MTMERLLRHRIADRGEISREFLDRGLADMASAVEYIRRLPYGRNSDRGDFRQVLREMKGPAAPSTLSWPVWRRSREFRLSSPWKK